MDGVPAWQHGSRPHAVKEVLEAHWTVLPHAVLHADVIVLQRRPDLNERVQGKIADLDGTITQSEFRGHVSCNLGRYIFYAAALLPN